jgi:hypothetical protein
MELQQPGLRDEWRVSGEWVFCFRSFWFPFGTLVYRFIFRVILQILDHGFLGMGTCLWL